MWKHKTKGGSLCWDEESFKKLKIDQIYGHVRLQHSRDDIVLVDDRVKFWTTRSKSERNTFIQTNIGHNSNSEQGVKNQKREYGCTLRGPT